jgi:hypothetical protein
MPNAPVLSVAILALKEFLEPDNLNGVEASVAALAPGWERLVDV